MWYYISDQFLMAQMLQCSGDMKTPGIVSVLECALNVVFNYLLIFPAHAVKLWSMTVRVPGAGLGVAGAALGTILSITESEDGNKELSLPPGEVTLLVLWCYGAMVILCNCLGQQSNIFCIRHRAKRLQCTQDEYFSLH